MKNKIIALAIMALVFAVPFKLAYTGLHETHPMISMVGFIFTIIGVFAAIGIAEAQKS
jgi:uncharacterized membrane protein